MNTNFTQEDIAKIRHLIDLGVTTKTEVQGLNDSFKETLNAVCDELDLDKRKVRKAVTIAFKATQQGDKDNLIEEERDTLDEVSHLLDAIKR